MNLKISLIYLSLVACLFCSCNLDYAPEFVSSSIADSKENKFFVAECKIDSMVVLDKRKPFVVKNVWIEKRHTSSMSFFGKESYQINDKYIQIAFDIDPNSYFNSHNDNNWIISGEKEDLDGRSGRIFILGLSDEEMLDSIRFIVYSLKNPRIINYDRIKVAEFKLKKQ